jgi:uncharacterized protein (UPF0335 family)
MGKPTSDAAENPRAVTGANSVAGDQLRTFIERIERLEDEKSTLGLDIREVYSEAKGSGFDTRVIRRIIRERKKDAAARAEEEAVFETYCSALGIFG